MKPYSVLVLLFILVYANFAQDSTKIQSRELRHGIQFQLQNLLTLKNFNDYTFSYRYLFNKNSGLRFGVRPTFNDSEDNVTTTFYDSILVDGNNNKNLSGLKVSIQYLTNVLSYNKFSLMIGGGPFLSHFINKSTNSNPNLNFNTASSYNSYIWDLGIEIVSGIEYKLADNVIISGEYSISLSSYSSDYSNIKRKIYNDGHQETIYKTEGEKKSFLLRGNSAILGLAIFF